MTADAPVVLDAYADALARASRDELLTPADMAVLFRMSIDRFGRLRRLGKFDRFMTHPVIGRACFRGRQVYRFITTDSAYEPTFGRASTRAAR
jgi:hypothetical protein